jgi:signal peptidase I
MDEHFSTISNKPRNAFLACFLSVILSGLGQIYNGQLKKATILIATLLLIPILFGLTKGTHCFYGLISLFAIKWGLKIYAVIDAWNNAKSQKNYKLKRYNTWYSYLAIALIAFVVFELYNTPLVLRTQSFKIPTISNYPTLQIEDRIIVDMDAYKNQDPDYGDLVIYLEPNGQIYTHRVIGLPNDTIQSIIVPENSYYLLGDNSDNSFDSRYIGCINREKIKGKVLYIYMGQTVDRINIDLNKK